MATTTLKRRREIVNPARPKRRVAVKKSRPAKRAQARKPATRPRRPTRKNLGETLTVGMLMNPAGGKKEKSKVAHKTRRSSRSKRASKTVRNPGFRTARRSGAIQNSGRRRRSTRRNPSIVGLAENAGWAILGAVGSRLAVQMALGANNKGAMGYGANLAAAGALYFGVKYGLKNSGAADMIALGSAIGLILRAMQDFTPFGQYAQLSGMGDYAATTFFVPLVPKNPQDGNSGDMLLPDQVTQTINSQINAKAALMQSANTAAGRGGGQRRLSAGVGSVSDGIGGRYSTKGRYS